eukprot:2868368-Pleurochrysis_carterae.AAC.3
MVLTGRRCDGQLRTQLSCNRSRLFGPARQPPLAIENSRSQLPTSVKIGHEFLLAVYFFTILDESKRQGDLGAIRPSRDKPRDELLPRGRVCGAEKTSKLALHPQRAIAQSPTSAQSATSRKMPQPLASDGRVPLPPDLISVASTNKKLSDPLCVTKQGSLGEPNSLSPPRCCWTSLRRAIPPIWFKLVAVRSRAVQCGRQDRNFQTHGRLSYSKLSRDLL